MRAKAHCPPTLGHPIIGIPCTAVCAAFDGSPRRGEGGVQHPSPSSQLLETCDLVVDVGGVYDPTVHRYDHHQRCVCVQVWACV